MVGLTVVPKEEIKVVGRGVTRAGKRVVLMVALSELTQVERMVSLTAAKKVEMEDLTAVKKAAYLVAPRAEMLDDLGVVKRAGQRAVLKVWRTDIKMAVPWDI
jgi:hypothetical protein